MKKNNRFNFNIVKIKGIIGLFIFIILIVEVKISHITNIYIPNIIWVPLAISSIWLMTDWFGTWFK